MQVLPTSLTCQQLQVQLDVPPLLRYCAMQHCEGF